jgi:hypothetical protein
MSYSYYQAVFHYLSSEHYRLGRLSDASRLRGDFGIFCHVDCLCIYSTYLSLRGSVLLPLRTLTDWLLLVLCYSLCLSTLLRFASHFISASRIRYLRQQAMVYRNLHALFRRVSDRHVAIVVTEFTGSRRSIRHTNQYLYLIQVLQRWFCNRYIINFKFFGYSHPFRRKIQTKVKVRVQMCLFHIDLFSTLMFPLCFMCTLIFDFVLHFSSQNM